MADRAKRLDEGDSSCEGTAVIFEPEVVAVMRKAMDASWSALAFAQFDDEHEMRATREVLAKRILEAAAAGERRVPVLSGGALGALEPRRAATSRTAGGTPWRVSRYAS